MNINKVDGKSSVNPSKDAQSAQKPTKYAGNEPRFNKATNPQSQKVFETVINGFK